MSEEVTLDKFDQGEGNDEGNQDWRKVKLHEVAYKRSDNVDPQKVELEKHVGLEHIDPNRPVPDWESLDDLSSTKRRFEAGDILFAKLRPNLEKSAQPDFEGVASTDIFPIVPEDNLNSKWLLYRLSSKSAYDYARRTSAGTRMPRTSWNLFSNFEFSLPPLPEQRKIATVLYTVDRAIEKTKEIIVRREKVKRGLMQDIFRYGIDSDGELRSTENNAYRETKYGTAPQEWEILPLEDIVADDASITYGIVKPGDHYPGGVPVVKVENITNGEVQTDNLLHTDPDIHEKYDRAELKEGDLLFTIRGTVGRMAFVPERLEGGNLTQDTARIRVKDANPEFVRYYLETATPHNYFERHTKGQAVQGINLEDLQQVPVHLPSREEQERIVDILDSHTEQIRNEREYRDQLHRLKRGLMQDLLSGNVPTTDTNIEVPEEITQHG